MKLPLACLGVAAALALSACSDRTTESTAPEMPTVAEIPDLPRQTPLQARQAPIVLLEDSLHVGADVAAPADALGQAAVHGGASVSHGPVQDGVGAAELIAYLRADAN